MSEFRLYPCNPSLLRQLARIREEQKRKARAEAVFNGLLCAVFALSVGVIGIVFACAFSCQY